MTKADAIQLLRDLELERTPPEKVPAALGVLARVLRELLEGQLT